MRLSTVSSARGLVALAILCAAAAPLSAQKQDVTQQKQHVVKKGDTLWDLARFYLNDPYRWQVIYEANRNVVRDPHWIYPAEKLIIPGIAPDTVRGTPGATVVAPERSIFYVAPTQNDSGPTLISTAAAAIPLVQPAEWLSAPWIADTARLAVKARVYKPYDPRDQNDKLTERFHPFDKLVIATRAPVSLNQRLLVIRPVRDLRGIGWIIQPLGVIRVDSVAHDAAVVMITRQFDDLHVGDLVIAMPAVPVMPTAEPIEVTGGPTGQVLDFLVTHPLYNKTDYAFVDIGSAQGLTVGDELTVFMPQRQPSTKSTQTLPEQPIARLQVIRVNPNNATTRVLRLMNSGLEKGLPLRVARKAYEGQATGDSSDATPVRLQFSWPAGLEANVHVRKVHVTTGEKRDSVQTALDYRMRTTVGPDGLVVSYDNFKIPAGAQATPADEQIPPFLPNFVVSSKGEFVRVVDAEKLLKQLEALFAEELASKTTTPQQKQMLRNAVSEKMLTAAAAEEWAELVAVWLDADMVKGEVLENEGEAPVPLIAGATLPMRFQYVFNDWVPCEKNQTTRECVELEIRSTPDADAVKEFVTRIAADAGAKDDYKLATMDIQNRVVVVTDPRRLLPYRMAVFKTGKSTGTEKGTPRSYLLREMKTYEFEYVRK